ncbi:unnamed protein product [Rhizoctonia solani]|uniref:F-box domain-containing protein n=1 Tax=Rhizoctonia solani TaxID=456999 RepID=A0A8H3GCU2_9AGAM|nr:unnamed protein product [Rhizoctonia solani]
MPEYLDLLPSHALQLWTDAQRTLDYAIQRYLESTMALQSSIRSSSHYDDSICVRNTLTESWLDGPPVPDKHAKLAQAQMYLNRMRNSLQSVNTLPLEVLFRVFRFAAFRTFHSQYNTPIPFSYQRDDHQDLVILTHVCSDWRTALLNNPSFWSRFSIDPQRLFESESERAQVYSIRARGSPQALYINESIDEPLFPINHPNLTNQIIVPRLDTLTQLSLLNFTDTRLVRQTILFWLKSGNPGALRTLIIQMHSNMTWPKPIYTGGYALAQRAESMLSPIRTLSLRGMRFAWDSAIYQNLVVLRIGNLRSEGSPTIHQILGILSGCPLLHTLRLYGMMIHPSYSTSPQAVYLTQLENLDLAALSSESVGQLLPNIFPQSKDLSLRFALPSWGAEGFTVIYPFLARTNITRLFIQKCDEPELDFVIGRCLSALPNLHTLILDLSMQPGDACLSGFNYLDESTGRYMPQCPRLHTLYVVTGSVSVQVVQQLVETHPLMRRLRFSACYIEPFEDELRYWLKPFVDDVRFNLRLDMAALFDWYHLMN